MSSSWHDGPPDWPWEDWEVEVSRFANCEPKLVRRSLGDLFSLNVSQASSAGRAQRKEEYESTLKTAAAFEKAMALYQSLPEHLKLDFDGEASEPSQALHHVHALIDDLRLQADVSRAVWNGNGSERSNRQNVPAHIIASGVARVFVAAGTPMTIGKAHDGQPAGNYCKAVQRAMDHFGVVGDWRRAAQTAKNSALEKQKNF